MGTNLRRPADLPVTKPGRHIALAIAAAVLLGLTVGILNALINAFGSEFGALRVPDGQRLAVLELLDAVFVTGSAWLLVAFGIGWFASTKGRALGLAIVALEVGVVVFYLIDEALRPIDKYNVINFFAWGLWSLVLGPAFSIAGFLARRQVRRLRQTRENKDSDGTGRPGQ